MKAFLITTSLLMVLFLGVLWSSMRENSGIIALEGYPDGVAFCGDEYHSVVHLNDATVWADNMATYVINKGHFKDPEVVQLVALAQNECSKFIIEGE